MPRSRSLKPRPRRDPRRDARIVNEILVDTYGPDERAMSWYYHLESRLAFPFKATCVVRRAISPLEVGETVTVTGLASEADSMADIVVLVRWQKRSLGVPLTQLKPHGIAADAAEAIADWHYWVKTGQRF